MGCAIVFQNLLEYDGSHPPIEFSVFDPANPRSNRLLAALADAEWEHCRPHLEHVDLVSEQVLYESGTLQSSVYFPTSAIVSLLYITESGACAEIAVVGNEGLVGVPLLLGGGSTSGSGIVQGTGQGFRIPSQSIKDAFDGSFAMSNLLLRYIQALSTQMAQTAVCNRHHNVDQQLCRLLLLRLDRLQSGELKTTHELIAQMLGVRREGVTEAAVKLQAAGLIRYRRGRIKVLDRAGLEQRSCECYGVVKKEYDRLLPIGPAVQRSRIGRQLAPGWAGAGDKRTAPEKAETVNGT